jgi:hypothetical protein
LLQGRLPGFEIADIFEKKLSPVGKVARNGSYRDRESLVSAARY